MSLDSMKKNTTIYPPLSVWSPLKPGSHIQSPTGCQWGSRTRMIPWQGRTSYASSWKAWAVLCTWDGLWWSTWNWKWRQLGTHGDFCPVLLVYRLFQALEAAFEEIYQLLTNFRLGHCQHSVFRAWHEQRLICPVLIRWLSIACRFEVWLKIASLTWTPVTSCNSYTAVTKCY